MEKIITIAIALFFVCCSTVFGQVSIVKDPYKQRQLEHMVFIRWGDFKPKWYYFLFHNKYRKGPDRRTILQLAPTDLVTRQTKDKSEEEEDDVGRVYAAQVWDAINRQLEFHYYFHFKPIFDGLNQDIDQLLSEAELSNTDPSAIQSFRAAQAMLNGEIEIIRTGWLERGDSAEAMTDIVLELRLLKGRLIKFVQLININQKYTTKQP